MQVAYSDFSKVLAHHKKEAHSSGHDGDALALRLSSIENYDFHVQQDGGTYIVSVAPTGRDQSQVVFGGGAKYVIAKKTFVINERVFTK